MVEKAEDYLLSSAKEITIMMNPEDMPIEYLLQHRLQNLFNYESRYSCISWILCS